MRDSVFIIAEAGVNHNGSIEIAKKLIDVASISGVDAIKFQSFNAENLVTKEAKQAEYQSKNMNKSISQFEMLKALELSYNEHLELFTYCKEKKIMFLSSAFDLENIDLLNKLGINLFKVPSGEIENVPYLRKIASTGKQIILSTGMCNLHDIEFALEILREEGALDVIVLHCNTDYPTKMQEVNLKAMNTIGKTFGVKVGYSDHTQGIEVAIAAVALGAKVIEKHFTLDKTMEGPDHKASLEPGDLKAMVIAIRNIEKALGDGIKKITHSEKKNMKVARKSLMCNKDIKIGEMFTAENLIAKRPGTGLSPKHWDDIVGKKANKNYSKDEMINLW